MKLPFSEAAGGKPLNAAMSERPAAARASGSCNDSNVRDDDEVRTVQLW